MGKGLGAQGRSAGHNPTAQGDLWSCKQQQSQAGFGQQAQAGRVSGSSNTEAVPCQGLILLHRVPLTAGLPQPCQALVALNILYQCDYIEQGAGIK